MATALTWFHGNWFLRNEPKLELTDVETDLINAALGVSAARWQASPDVERVNAILAEHPDALDRIDERLLKVAIGMRGCGETVGLLLARGVPLDVDHTTYTVLHEAAWAGATDTLQAVFESGASDATPVSVKKPHTGWPDNLSLMYWAAWGGRPDMAKLLIKHGAGVHHEIVIKGNGERGTTVLHEAVAPGPWPKDGALRTNDGKTEVAQVLIADGAQYDICSACALHDAARTAELLETDPACAKLADPFGMTPLHWAARANSGACIALLLEADASVHAMTKTKRTPLQLAAEQDAVSAIEALASAGADLDTQDKKGRTPLHRATYEGKLAAANALLAAGADSTLPNKNGKTAFEIARKEAKVLKTAT